MSRQNIIIDDVCRTYVIVCCVLHAGPRPSDATRASGGMGLDREALLRGFKASIVPPHSAQQPPPGRQSGAAA